MSLQRVKAGCSAVHCTPARELKLLLQQLGCCHCA